MALVTLTQVKDYYGYPDSDDALVTSLIDQASALIETLTGRTFEQDSFTEFMDGGAVDLIVQNIPIETSSPAPVITDYADPDNPVIVDPDTYTVYPQQGLIRYSPQGYGDSILSDNFSHNDTLPVAYSLWTFGARRWEVVYTGGTANVPDDIQLATIFLVGWAKETGSAGGSGAYTSESLGDYSYSLNNSSTASSIGSGKYAGLPSNVALILKNYGEDWF